MDYAELCFREFGDRVKHWLTFNETWAFSLQGYATGLFAPGRGGSDDAVRAAIQQALPSNPYRSYKSSDTGSGAGQARDGNPRTEPYIVAHNQLRAHAAAVKLYKDRYQVEFITFLFFFF